MKKILFLILAVACWSSCNQGNKGQSSGKKYELETGAANNLKIPIDENTKYVFSALFPYYDKSGKEYLTFKSDNNILFYDIKTGKNLFNVKLDTEGPNGVGNQVSGYHIEDLNNIYITSFQKLGLVKVDTSGTIKQFIEYGKTDNGHNVVPSFRSASYQYTPIIINKNIIYITQHPNQFSGIKETPVSVAIDTSLNAFKELPLRYPNLITDEELNIILIGLGFSRDFNGKQFVYSFYMDEKIYITDIETDEEIKIPIKSKYINELKFQKYPEDIGDTYKILIEMSRYGNLFYDRYRDVYYRFVHIGGEPPVDYEYSLRELYFNGANQFSVIILDKDFNIIGETLFPKYTYDPSIAFVHKDGLYISDSHILNPSFDENVLSFKCFSLKEIK